MSASVPIRTLQLLSLVLLVASCSKSPAPAAPAARPEVEVIRLQAVDVPAEVELPGRIEAYRVAEVRARVSGIVARRLYQEGQVVKAGTPLFEINPEQLEASRQEAEATLESARATLDSATDKLQRYQALVTDQSVSQRDFRAAQAEAQLARAAVSNAQARLQRARLDLGYAKVTAPIAGVARRALVTEGALVGKDEATHLTTIDQIDRVYVNFSQSSAEVFALRKALHAGQLKPGARQGQVELLLPDGSVYGTTGSLSFADVSVNPSTDAVVMRAVFDNPDQLLMPGAYVRLRLHPASQPQALLVPRNALLRDAFASRVWVVNAQQVLESRTVTVGRLLGSQWLVTQGLQAGETVVVTNASAQVAGTQVRIKQVAAPTVGNSAS